MARQTLLMLVGAMILLSACSPGINLNVEVRSPFIFSQKIPPVANPAQTPETFDRDSCFETGCHQAFENSNAVSEHPPFVNGQCERCHSQDSHHSQAEWTPADTISLCHSCHSVESLGNSHPIGEGTIDPNTGQLVTCISCHSPHYASHPDQLLLDGREELCVHCHTEFLINNQ